MGIPTHTEMMKLEKESPGYLNELFERESKLLIESAPKENQHQLECLANGCKLRRQASKNNTQSMITAQTEMFKLVGMLSEKWQQVEIEVLDLQDNISKLPIIRNNDV